MAERSRVILHADMDAFYAAVEQRDRPELRGKPVVVGGSGGRGVVMTASYEARTFGIHSAMPGAWARRLCPNAIFVRPRMRLYAAEARRLRELFGEFTPLVEPLSLDEAFLDITGSLNLFGGALAIGKSLRQRVRETTLLNVSVGIGPTKTIAKIASGICKPDGLLEVRADEAETFLHRLPVHVLWGVGPTTQAELERLGIGTIGDLARTDGETLRRRLGRTGLWLFDLARGRDPRRVTPARTRKSYGEEQTFSTDLRDGGTVRRAIATQAESVARRLRADARRARTVTLKLKLAHRLRPGKYPVLTRRKTLPDAVDDGRSIGRAALQLWEEVGSDKTVRLIGVSVSNIPDDGAGQLSLFDPSKRRDADLERILDELRARFGARSVRRGG